VAVGSDHPELATSTVEEAFEALEGGADVTIGPAADGGYYLIGAHRETLSAELFRDIDWGSASVLSSTLERCGSLGLAVHRLSLGRDIDVPEDLERLAGVLAVARPDVACPATERLLRRWGRLQPS
jgi:glycosyltransferase A (GT-A) superfamily protein (DUF2064 family)